MSSGNNENSFAPKEGASTVWFTVGGIIEPRRLFSDPRLRTDNPQDDGRGTLNTSVRREIRIPKFEGDRAA